MGPNSRHPGGMKKGIHPLWTYSIENGGERVASAVVRKSRED